MRDWFVSVAGEEYATAMMWIVGIAATLVVLLILARLLRRLTSGTFVAGGRNRRQRLAVTDATAVDSQRRLVLVRRDNVEHLILIGGPSDVVIEQNIPLVKHAAGESTVPAPQRPKPAASTAPAAPPPPRERPQPAAAPAAGEAVHRPPVDEKKQVVAPERPQASPPTPPPRAGARQEPQLQEVQRHPAAPAAGVATSAAASPAKQAGPAETRDDESLLSELEVSMERPQQERARSPQAANEIETEMSRLLEELSDERK